MIRNPIIKSLATIFLVTSLTSCINLKKVNDYSAQSLKTLKKFEGVSYTFTKSCKNRCEIQQLEKQQLFQEECDCKENVEADSVTLVLYNAISGYFAGLTKLSANELTTYKFDTTALTEGKFGDVTIDREHAQSYGKMSTILLKAFTDTYRKKKITRYIGEANAPIQTLINVFNFNLEANLSKKLDVEKQRYQSYYFDLLKDSSTSVFEKKQIIEEYDIVMAGLTAKKKQISIYGRGLRKIAAGHQKLYDNRNKLTASDIEASLAQYGSDLQDIDTEFNKLKSEDQPWQPLLQAN